MGFYIETKSPKNKVDFLIKNHNCKVIDAYEGFERLKNNEGVVVVVDNGPFEAAAFAYDEAELNAFLQPTDYRPKTILAIDYQRGCELSGYTGN